MRIYTVPAMYAPEVVAEIRRVIERIDRHRAVDIRDDSRLVQLADAIIPETSLNRALTGDLMITVAEAPAESDAKVFSLDQRERVA